MLRFFLTFLYTYVIENVDVCALQFALDPDIKIEIGLNENSETLDNHKNILIKCSIGSGWSVAAIDQSGIKDLEFIPKPPEFHWQLPSEMKILKLEWSPPQRIEKYGFVYNGYSEQFQIINMMQIVKTDAKTDKKIIKLRIAMPLCKDFCKVVEKEIEFDLDKLKKIDLLKNELKSVKVSKEVRKYSFTEILLFVFSAFVGGLFLNAMPCVFPVLSLKLFDLMKLSQKIHDALEFQHVRKICLFFILGVICSFVSLGALQYTLNTLGYWVGWGFQLQSSGFVFFLSVLFFMMSLNFFGVFEIGLSLVSSLNSSQKNQETKKKATLNKHEYINSFYNGVLLCVVATPCTAPFMGAALGATLTLPLTLSMLIYLVLALGLTFPFICFLIQPQWLSFMPKPGQWMETLKSIMGFAVLASSLWLLWVLLSSKPDVLIWVFWVFWTLAFILWIMGKLCDLRYADKVRRISSLVGWGLIVGIVMGSIYVIEKQTMDKQYAPLESTGHAHVYSIEKVNQLKRDKKSYLLNVTADWCVTCQWNKKFILNTTEFRDILKKRDIQYLEADWSRYEPEITHLLNQHGSNSIPFLIYYDGNTKKTIHWSGLLSVGDLTAQLIQK